ncbi:hypothetical protein MTO96_051270 [Rhipicephalus appendiculatus]
MTASRFEWRPWKFLIFATARRFLPDAALHGIDISIQLADDARQINGNDNIDLLIGSDYYWQVATGRIRRLSNGLTAIETLFGWTLQGAVESFKTVRQTYTTTVMNVVVRPCDLDADLSKHLEAFWDVEHMGILPAKDTNTSDAVLQEFKKTVKESGWKLRSSFPLEGER